MPWIPQSVPLTVPGTTGAYASIAENAANAHARSAGIAASTYVATNPQGSQWPFGSVYGMDAQGGGVVGGYDPGPDYSTNSAKGGFGRNSAGNKMSLADLNAFFQAVVKAINQGLPLESLFGKNDKDMMFQHHPHCKAG